MVGGRLLAPTQLTAMETTVRHRTSAPAYATASAWAGSRCPAGEATSVAPAASSATRPGTASPRTPGAPPWSPLPATATRTPSRPSPPS
jgi:hypothetical protein